MISYRTVIILLVFCGVLSCAAAAHKPPAGKEKIDALIHSMTLAEKIFQLHAHDKFFSGGVERLGIPPIVMSDGPHGVRADVKSHSWASANRPEDRCTYLPVGTVMAATWNPKMARLHGEVLGAEARFRGKDIILGPGINIIRTPLCGRNFEYIPPSEPM